MRRVRRAALPPTSKRTIRCGYVYVRVHARTNIDLDDVKVHRVMALYGLRSKRAAVDFALSRVLGPDQELPVSMLDMVGSGWEGDLDELRGPAPA